MLLLEPFNLQRYKKKPAEHPLFYLSNSYAVEADYVILRSEFKTFV
jgi:hypothetical protein